MGCDEAANRNEPTEPVTKRYPEFDQMLASARARAIPNKRRYTVTLSNHGEDKLVALVAIRQQWKSVEEVNPPWQEQILPTDEAGVIEVAAGAEYAFEVHPKTFEKVFLRFGITLIGQQEDQFPKLVVWSNSVTPATERWTKTDNAEQD